MKFSPQSLMYPKLTANRYAHSDQKKYPRLEALKPELFGLLQAPREIAHDIDM